MKPYRTIDEIFNDRRKGVILSLVFENMMQYPQVWETEVANPFDLLSGINNGDYLDATTDAWLCLDVTEQMRYASIYQSWYASNLRVPIDVIFKNSSGVEMTLIPPMRYWMGSVEMFDEPRKAVTIKKPYRIGKYLVTQQEWERHFGKTHSYIGNRLTRHPVEGVDWHMARRFCRENRLALPHEREWEMACRAGTTTTYYYGNNEGLLDRYAWYGRNSGDRPQIVGEKLPNAWGLYDMHGNLWEWCRNQVTDPDETDVLKSYVLRGGSFENSEFACTSTTRINHESDYKSYSVGFRVLRYLDSF